MSRKDQAIVLNSQYLQSNHLKQRRQTINTNKFSTILTQRDNNNKRGTVTE